MSAIVEEASSHKQIASAGGRKLRKNTKQKRKKEEEGEQEGREEFRTK